MRKKVHLLTVIKISTRPAPKTIYQDSWTSGMFVPWL